MLLSHSSLGCIAAPPTTIALTASRSISPIRRRALSISSHSRSSKRTHRNAARHTRTLTVIADSQCGPDHAPPPSESSTSSDSAEDVTTSSPSTRDEGQSTPISSDVSIQQLMWHPALHDPIRVPRNPIVLCHGLYGFDVRGPSKYPSFQLHYWSSTLEILRKRIGAEVFVAGVPGTEAVKQRAQTLHRAVAEVARGRDISFLAHSMGGLDARHLISHIKPTEYNVRSLTTLSTPHRGSEFMAWCRANIGLGAALDAELAQAAVDATLHNRSVKPPPPLPWSLKEPLLSHRKAETEADKPLDSKPLVPFPGLPYSLGASLSSYLLRLIDSPAYSNLTPHFLRDIFNPSTPDDPNVLYMSAAARVRKMGVWHPLWLPKLILDQAEKDAIAHGLGPPDGQRGNDGLVSVESAQWGQFLGIVENCDHWQMRGAAGFTAVAPKNSLDGAVVEKSSSWGWEDVNKLVGGAIKAKSDKLEPVAKAIEADTGDERKSRSGLNKLAEWIVARVPGVGSSDSSSAKSAPATSSSSLARAGPVSHSRSDRQQDRFDIERLYIALCRQLYDRGL